MPLTDHATSNMRKYHKRPRSFNFDYKLKKCLILATCELLEGITTSSTYTNKTIKVLPECLMNKEESNLDCLNL